MCRTPFTTYERSRRLIDAHSPSTILEIAFGLRVTLRISDADPEYEIRSPFSQQTYKKAPFRSAVLMLAEMLRGDYAVYRSISVEQREQSGEQMTSVYSWKMIAEFSSYYPARLATMTGPRRRLRRRSNRRWQSTSP